MTNYCFFNTVNAWGGGEKWHLEVVLYLHNKGQKVLLVAAPNSPLAQKAMALGITVQTISLSNLSFLNPFVLFKIARLLKQFKIDSLIMNSPRDLKCAGLAARFIKVPKVIFRRGSDIAIKNNMLNRFLYQSVIHKVLVNSPATEKSLNANNKDLVAKSKIKLIPNGIDSSKFLASPVSPIYTKQADELVLCTLGRLVPQKNQVFLIDLAVELKKRQFLFKFLIGGSGPLENELRQISKAKGVADCIMFAGFVERPKDLYGSGDIFLLPSLWEGFGYVLAEAGLCALPSIALNVSSNGQIIQDGKTGILVSEPNPLLFADAVMKLSENEPLRREMGAAAKSFVKKNFEAEDIFKEIEHVIS
jgi:glycosyltransferase involved in cell wall biosynthesis